MNTLLRKYLPYLLLFIIVLASRFPFLHAGYGVEEDSWGIALAGLHTHLTGIYEPSRFPGHPVHEYIYSACPNHSELFYNFFSAFFSAIAAVVFALILKELNFRYKFLAAFAFAFTPVVYISSTYTIDFTWTLAFMLSSLFFLLRRQYIFCGIFLGLAIGCRITMGAMLIPFIMILWRKDNLSKILKIVLPMTAVVVLAFLPLVRQFGTEFFMYYDQFPYPPLSKVFYKMIPGVFGFVGTIALLVCTGVYFFRKDWASGKLFLQPLNSKIVSACFVVIILFTISYFRLPQKSGYMITVIPFIIILAGYYLNSKWFFVFCVSLILSSFIFSINLTDKLRGAEYSHMAMKFTVSGQEIFLDPLSGPIFSDFSKRKQKSRYVRAVLNTCRTVGERTVVIAGWWYNEIAVKLSPDTRSFNVTFEPYMDEAKMTDYLSKGYMIKYLPEQNIYNDQMFRMDITDELAEEFRVADPGK